MAVQMARLEAGQVAPRSGHLAGHEAGVFAGEKGTRFSRRRADFALAHPGFVSGKERTPSFPDYALPTTRKEGVVGKPGDADETGVTDWVGSGWSGG